MTMYEGTSKNPWKIEFKKKAYLDSEKYFEICVDKDFKMFTEGQNLWHSGLKFQVGMSLQVQASLHVT